jgi:hypothetical protein
MIGWIIKESSRQKPQSHRNCYIVWMIQGWFSIKWVLFWCRSEIQDGRHHGTYLLHRFNVTLWDKHLRNRCTDWIMTMYKGSIDVAVDMRTRFHTNSPRNAPPSSQLTITTGKLHQQPANSAKSTKFWKRGCSEGYFRHGWSLLVPVTWRSPQIGLIWCVYSTAQQAVFPLFRPITMHVHNTWISYVNKSVSVVGFSGFVCIINNQILRKHTAILVCPVQGKQCVHLKFSDNFCTKNY